MLSTRRPVFIGFLLLPLIPDSLITAPHAGIQDVAQYLHIIQNRQLFKFLAALRHHHGKNDMAIFLKIGLLILTRFTAECIRAGIRDFCSPTPEMLVIGGGGSKNPVLMEFIRRALPGCSVVTNEDLGMDSEAKEAVAFAVLANEALFCHPNNAVGATGAAHPVVMGKISF